MEWDQDGRAVQGAAFRSQSNNLGVGSIPTFDIEINKFIEMRLDKINFWTGSNFFSFNKDFVLVYPLKTDT